MAKIYRINEFGKRIGRSTSTLRRWDREKKLIAKRMPSGHRYYDESDVRKLFGIKEDCKKNIVYCRVSSNGQKKDLQTQIRAMEQFCLNKGLPVSEWITEIAGGMNFKRKKFLNLMEMVSEGRVEKIIIAHKDRLCRFGFDYFIYMAERNGCEIIIANQETLSPQQEMVEDLMAIIHTFSCRLYGLRKYKKKIKEIVNLESHQNP